MVAELDVMKAIDQELSKVEDPPTRLRILRWAWEKFGDGLTNAPDGIVRNQAKKKSGQLGESKTAAHRIKATPPTMVKDLDLKPGGKKSFADFIKEKSPESQHEKCLVSVYYLANTLGTKQVDVNQVFTCFKIAGWRVPSNLKNAMQVAASTKGWLDTADMGDIKVTVHGDNYVEHDLPTKNSH